MSFATRRSAFQDTTKTDNKRKSDSENENSSDFSLRWNSEMATPKRAKKTPQRAESPDSQMDLFASNSESEEDSGSEEDSPIPANQYEQASPTPSTQPEFKGGLYGAPHEVMADSATADHKITVHTHEHMHIDKK